MHSHRQNLFFFFFTAHFLLKNSSKITFFTIFFTKIAFFLAKQNYFMYNLFNMTENHQLFTSHYDFSQIEFKN